MKASIAILALSLAAALTACKDETASVVEKTVNIQSMSDAAALTEAAEELVTPFSFFYADQILDKALAKDPNYSKALFYKNLIKPLMKLKGMAQRVTPLIEDREQLANYEKEIAAIPESGLKQFALAGRSDLKNESDVQDVLASIRNGFNDFRLYAKKNKDKTINIRVFTSLWDEKNNCRANNPTEGIYKIVCRSDADMTIEPAAYTIDRANLEVLQQAYAGHVFYLTWFTSYDFTGAKDLTEKLQDARLSEQQRLDIVHSQKQFLKIRKDQSMSTVIDLGSDLVAAARWVKENQDTLCTVDSKKICIDTENSAEFFQQLESVVMGPITMTLQLEKNSVVTPYTTQVDVLAWFRNPIQDLKVFVPTQENSSESMPMLGDKTLGGLLPNADLDRVLQK